MASRTSSSPPPTCTVPASRASGAVHGIGPSSAQSTFSVDGPGAEAAQRRGVRTAERVAGQRQQRSGARVGDDERRADPVAVGGGDARDPPALHRDARDARPAADVAAELAQARDERLGQPLRAALRARPADGVAQERRGRSAAIALPAPCGGTSPCIAAP